MGQFYDEDKIKALENAATPAQQPAQPASPPPNPAAPKGSFYDEDKIKSMQGVSAPAAGRNLGQIALIALLVIAGAVFIWWKITHNPATMVVDLNKGSVTELSYLPGIGEAKAKVIIEHRPYKSIEDLKKVPGIGEKTFEKMKPRVKVE